MSSSSLPPLEPENTSKYPRPPALQPVPQRLRVIWKSAEGAETTIADTTSGYRVLETNHPPTYYLPTKDVKTELLTPSPRSSFCEWKGRATYWNVQVDSSASTIPARVWSYEKPTSGFKPIAGYLSFYASAGTKSGQGDWTCFVNDEAVEAQDGDFYGGWKTANLDGKMKGAPGTLGW